MYSQNILQFFCEFTFIFAAGMGELGGGGGQIDGIDGRWRGPRLATSPPDFDGSDAGVMGELTPHPLLATISGKIYYFSGKRGTFIAVCNKVGQIAFLRKPTVVHQFR
jgi:hypothetical protein